MDGEVLSSKWDALLARCDRAFLASLDLQARCAAVRHDAASIRQLVAQSQAKRDAGQPMADTRD